MKTAFKPLNPSQFAGFAQKYICGFTGKKNGDISHKHPSWPGFLAGAMRNQSTFIIVQGDQKERRFRFDWKHSERILSVQRLNSGNFEMSDVDLRDVHDPRVVSGARCDGQTATYDYPF
jgi:hypothetical protein